MLCDFQQCTYSDISQYKGYVADVLTGCVCAYVVVKTKIPCRLFTISYAVRSQGKILNPLEPFSFFVVGGNINNQTN